MVKCPNCKAKISFRNAFFGKLNKKGCPYCGVRLATNKKYAVIIGGIGGGTGSIILINLYKSNFSIHEIIITLVWLILIIICSYIFADYKIIEK